MGNGGVKDELNLGVILRTLLHDGGCPQSVGTVDDVDLVGETGQECRLFHGGVSTTHDGDSLLLVEGAITGGTP